MEKREDLLRLHQFLPHSRANGPGLRSVIWVQGCSLGCPGCFNPETHTFEGGEVANVDDLFERIRAREEKIEGVTVSGGEPLQQMPALTNLLRRIRRETRLSLLVFTGYTWQEIERMPDSNALLECVDVLIAGRYEASERLARGLRGSANKTVHLLTDRYRLEEMESVPRTEAVITRDGQLVLSGINPIKRSKLK
jgi:anaerobic ribonucleoside-triphosphate reductase activating protein